MKTNKILSIVTASIVVTLAVLSFVLSFEALQQKAYDNGVSYTLSFIYPAVLDGAIIVFSLSALWFHLRGENKVALIPTILVFLFVVSSTIFNAQHAAQKDLWGYIMAAIPPVALFLSDEMLMLQIMLSTKQNAIIDSLQSLTNQLKVKKAEFDNALSKLQIDYDNRKAILQTEVDNMALKLDKLQADYDNRKAILQSEIDNLKTQKSELKPARRNVKKGLSKQDRQERVKSLASEGLSLQQIVENFNVGERTIRRDLEEMSIPVPGNGKV